MPPSISDSVFIGCIRTKLYIRVFSFHYTSLTYLISRHQFLTKIIFICKQDDVVCRMCCLVLYTLCKISIILGKV